MGATENRQKSSSMAAFLKERGITRGSGQCPMGCGGSYSLSKNGLQNHLAQCQSGRVGSAAFNRKVQKVGGKR